MVSPFQVSTATVIEFCLSATNIENVSHNPTKISRVITECFRFEICFSFHIGQKITQAWVILG